MPISLIYGWFFLGLYPRKVGRTSIINSIRSKKIYILIRYQQLILRRINVLKKGARTYPATQKWFFFYTKLDQRLRTRSRQIDNTKDGFREHVQNLNEDELQDLQYFTLATVQKQIRW
jgi:hypothetical protein